MKIWLIVGACLAALSVLIGAFGAHGLKSKISIHDLATFEIGVRYQMYHALAILLLGVISNYFPDSLISPVAYFMVIGVIIFSGSLYLLVLTDIKWFGAITPLGGICLIIGWILLAVNIYRS